MLCPSELVLVRSNHIAFVVKRYIISVRPFNLPTPGCTGISHTPLVGSIYCAGEMTAADSHTARASGWLLQPGCFVGNGGITEY